MEEKSQEAAFEFILEDIGLEPPEDLYRCPVLTYTTLLQKTRTCMALTILRDIDFYFARARV